MKNLLQILSIIALTMMFSSAGFAQVETEEGKERLKKYHKLNLSYIIGGQLYNDNFLYSPGYSFSVVNGILLNKNVSLGLGVGGQFFKEEKFLPIYFDLTAYKNSKKHKKHSSFINTQLGYAIGWNTALSNMETYDFNGGVFISAGLGRKTKISDELSVMFQASYRHQFAELSYKVSGVKNYEETLNYDMLVLTVSLILEK